MKYFQYLGRWWLQDKYTDLSDVTGKCWSQVYSVNYVDQTVHRLTEHQSIMSVNFRAEYKVNQRFSAGEE